MRAAQYVRVWPSSPSPLPSSPSTATPCTWWRKSLSMTPSSCTTRCECTTRWSRRRRTKTNPKNGNQKLAIIMLLGWIMSFSPLRWSMTIRNITKWGVRLHVLNGIQFNPWLILSLDFQFAYTHGYDEDLTFVMPMKGISNGSRNGLRSFENVGFKLGLDFRYRWFNRFKWSPVIGIAGGPSIELTSYPLQDGEFKSYWGWGGYISNYLGCSYRYWNNKQLWFGASWTVDFGYVFIAIPLLGFRFEIQL